MARQYKTSYKVYTAWNYQKEIEDLNKASEQGWQLIKGGCFSSKFKWNPDIRYCYQIDYPGKIEDMGRYIETYREQGWEYVDSTFNGWHFFRKIFDPSLPEEQYEIFTDRDSLEQMKRRWMRIAFVALLLNCVSFAAGVIRFVFENTLPHLILMTTMGILVGFLVYGLLAMKKTGKRKMARWDSMLFAVVFLLVVIAGNAAAVILANNRSYFSLTYRSEETAAIPAEREKGVQWTDIGINYSDNYYLTLEIEADAPVCFTIENGSGETVYEVKTESLTEEHKRIYLEKGSYTIQFSDFVGGTLNVSLNID